MVNSQNESLIAGTKLWLSLLTLKIHCSDPHRVASVSLRYSSWEGQNQVDLERSWGLLLPKFTFDLNVRFSSTRLPLLCPMLMKTSGSMPRHPLGCQYSRDCRIPCRNVGNGQSPFQAVLALLCPKENVLVPRGSKPPPRFPLCQL